jgi:preprotein translocase subunit SecE
MNPLLRYFSEARAELAKVNWPSRKETVRLTTIVIGFTLVTAAFIGSIDYVLSLALQKLILKG